MRDNTQSTDLRTEDLLTQHVGWLRGLARQLVRDAHVADDLVQETVVRALQTPPREAPRLRSWLASVLRNLVSERHRARGNLAARERRSARPDGVPPTDELVGRLEMQRQLADAIERLDEPFRTTVLLRFYEGLEPRRIAARLSVPVATVKSRLQRGLERLRRDLDASYGDRRTWMGVLLPLVGPPALVPTPTAPTLGGLALNAKLWLAAGAAVAACAFVYFFPSSAADSDGRPVAPPAAARDVAARAPARGDDGSPPRSIDRRGVDQRPPRLAAAGTPAVHAVRGRVLDASGRPAAGLEIAAAGHDDLHATTAADGSFGLETAAASLTLEVAAADWVTVRAGAWSARSRMAPVVIVARAIDLEGRVVDERGVAVPSARLDVALPDGEFQSRFDTALDATIGASWETRADGDGGFAFDRVPAIAGATLRVTCDGFEAVELDLPLTSASGMTVSMFRADVAAGVAAYRGQVLRPDGSPAAGARVCLGRHLCRANDRGFFAFAAAEVSPRDQLAALDVGFRPVRRPLPASPDEFVVLRLAGETLSLSGRIIHADGSPAAGARILIDDPTPFGVMGMLPLRAEGLAAGLPLPPLALESATWSVDRFDETRGSARPVGDANAMVPWIATDANGRFELGGLDDRSYRLLVLDRNLGWSHLTRVVAAGTRDVEIRLPRPDVWPTVRGRVVTAHGDPVADVSITPFWNVVAEAAPARGGGTAEITRWFQAPGITTDENGAFSMTDVPKSRLQFLGDVRKQLTHFAGPRRPWRRCASSMYRQIRLRRRALPRTTMPRQNEPLVP